MDLSGFKARLEALGPDLSGWPAPEADAAAELLAANVQAQDLFAQVTAEGLESSDAGHAGALIERIWREIQKPD